MASLLYGFALPKQESTKKKRSWTFGGHWQQWWITNPFDPWDNRLRFSHSARGVGRAQPEESHQRRVTLQLSMHDDRVLDTFDLPNQVAMLRRLVKYGAWINCVPAADPAWHQIR